MATDRTAYYKAYREANREKRRAINNKWKQNNKEKQAAQKKLYREANKQKLSTYVKNNRAIYNSANKRYKEVKRDNNFIITELDKFVEQEIYELAQIRTEQLGKEWHVDHTIPLSKGGPHAIHNLEVVPKAWNLSKGNTHSNRYREVL